MSYPTMTRRSYEEFVKLIKRAEWLSLKLAGDSGKKVQIWYNYETGEFEFNSFDPKHRFVDEHYKREFIEVYRVSPHTLKKLYSKDKNWKSVDWKDEYFTDTAAYGDLMEFHINRIHESKFDIKGKIREAFLRYNINGEGLELDDDDGFYDDGSGEMDDDEGGLDYDDQLVNWEGKSREDIEDELYGEDDDEY